MRRYARLAWKFGFPLLVAAAVGWYFYDKLSQPALWAGGFQFRYEWLLPAAIIYLIAYAVWGRYFVTLLRNQGATVSTATGMRSYFISQTGKYLPGKVMVIVIRIAMLGNIGISRTAVGIVAAYESIVWAGSGALVGIVLLPEELWDGLRHELRQRGGDLPEFHRYWLILPMVIAPIGLVGLNRFVNRINRWRYGPDARQLPRVKLHMVIFGLAWDSLGWLIIGLCLLFTMHGLLPGAKPLESNDALDLISIASIAYVMGFVAFFMPAGVGVRDVALQLLLAVQMRAHIGPGVAAEQIDGLAAIIAIVFRLLGTLSELIVAGIMFRFAPSAAKAALHREAAAIKEGA